MRARIFRSMYLFMRFKHHKVSFRGFISRVVFDGVKWGQRHCAYANWISTGASVACVQSVDLCGSSRKKVVDFLQSIYSKFKDSNWKSKEVFFLKKVASVSRWIHRRLLRVACRRKVSESLQHTTHTDRAPKYARTLQLTDMALVENKTRPRRMEGSTRAMQVSFLIATCSHFN